MLPKLVCRLVPALVLRQVLVKSMKPMGVIRVSPIFIVRGEVPSNPGALSGSFCGGVGGSAGFGEGAAGSGGTIGARLATSPGTDFGVGGGTGTGSAGAAVVAVTLSICFF